MIGPKLGLASDFYTMFRDDMMKAFGRPTRDTIAAGVSVEVRCYTRSALHDIDDVEGMVNGLFYALPGRRIKSEPGELNLSNDDPSGEAFK